jgi:hypothetical protein
MPYFVYSISWLCVLHRIYGFMQISGGVHVLRVFGHKRCMFGALGAQDPMLELHCPSSKIEDKGTKWWRRVSVNKPTGLNLNRPVYKPASHKLTGLHLNRPWRSSTSKASKQTDRFAVKPPGSSLTNLFKPTNLFLNRPVWPLCLKQGNIQLSKPTGLLTNRSVPFIQTLLFLSGFGQVARFVSSNRPVLWLNRPVYITDHYHFQWTVRFVFKPVGSILSALACFSQTVRFPYKPTGSLPDLSSKLGKPTGLSPNWPVCFESINIQLEFISNYLILEAEPELGGDSNGGSGLGVDSFDDGEALGLFIA